MKRVLLAPALLLLLAACGDQAADPASPATDAGDEVADLAASYGSSGVLVTSAADDGEGSFRAAAAAASANPDIKHIRFGRSVGQVQLASPVVFSGSQDLAIDGRGTTLVGADCAECHGFVTTGGGDLDVSNLTVQNAGGNGIAVLVPAGTSGVVHVRLSRITIRENGLHGVLVQDQVQETVRPGEPDGFDSDASIAVVVEGSLFERNGLVGLSDWDGLRVNDGGLGGITAHIVRSRFIGNGADGVELDERGEGDVRLEALQSNFDENGPRDPEDLDDGFDIDEAGAGSVYAKVVGSSFSRNRDEGADFNESDAGDLHLDFTRVSAIGNDGDGIQTEELDEGCIYGEFRSVVSTGQVDGDGAQFEEAGVGDIQVRFIQSSLTGNARRGINAEQADEGGGLITLIRTDLANNGRGEFSADGVEVRFVPAR